MASVIPCFDHSTELKNKFLEAIKGKEDLSEQEQKEIGKKIALDYHKDLHNQLNDLRGRMGIKAADYQEPLPPEKPKIESNDVGEEKTTGIKNVISKESRVGLNLPEVDTPKLGLASDVLREGKELVESGKIDPLDVVNRINEKGEGMEPNEAKAMQYYMHQLRAGEDLVRKQIADSDDPIEKANLVGKLQQISDQQDAATEANIRSGTTWSQVGNIRKIEANADFTPARNKTIIKEAYGGEIPKDVQEKLDKITQERDAAIEAQNKAEERLKNAAAEKVLQRVKAQSEKTLKLKQSKEQLVKEEQELLQQLRKSLKKDFNNLNAGIPVPQETLETLGKLAVNYFKQGANTVESLVNKLHSQLKDDIEGLTKKDLRDFLAQHEPLLLVKDTERLTKKAERIEDKTTPTILKTTRGKLEGVSEKPNFTPIKQKQLSFKTDNEWVKANQRVVNAEYKMRQLKREAFESQKNWYQKGLMWAGRAVRLSILSGYNVLLKLSSAATVGGALKRIPEQAIGAIYSGIFKGISEKAPIEGMPYVSSEIKFYKEFFNPKKFFQNAWEILKTGSSNLTKRLGSDTFEHIPGLYLPTDLHQIIKDPLKRATFEASFNNGMKWASKHGMDINDPLIIQTIENGAYKRANYEIFQEQRWLTKAVNDAKNKMDKGGNIGSTGKFAADFMLPISTVPTNIGARLLSTSPLGLMRGTAKVVSAYREGIENLKPEEADAVMRQLKQGTLGTALWLAGWFGYKSFGGLYSKFDPDKKRQEGDFGSDQMMINGKMIPKPAQHALPLEILQLSATSRRIYENYRQNRKDNTIESATAAGLGSIGAMAEQIPVIETGAHILGATQEPYQAQKLKEDMKRRFEPQILRETGVIKPDTKTGSKGKDHP